MSRTLFLEAYCRARLVLTNLSVDDGQLPKPVGKARRWESSEEAVDGRTVFRIYASINQRFGFGRRERKLRPRLMNGPLTWRLTYGEQRGQHGRGTHIAKAC